MTSNYTVKWGYYQEFMHECETWQEVKFQLKELGAPDPVQNITVIGKDYDVGGPDELVRSGLTEDEELELEELLA